VCGPWLNNPGEVVGLVFSTTIRVPGRVSLSLCGDITVRSVSNGGEQLTSAIVLVTTSDGVSRLGTTVLNQSVVAHLDIREVVGLVFLATIRVPRLAALSFRWDISLRGMGNGEVEGTAVVLVSRRGMIRSRRSFVKTERHN